MMQKKKQNKTERSVVIKEKTNHPPIISSGIAIFHNLIFCLSFVFSSQYQTKKQTKTKQDKMKKQTKLHI